MPQPHRTAHRGARLLRSILLAFVGLLAFGVALVATMPAQSLTRIVQLPPQVLGLDGRIVTGTARMQDGYRIAWRLRGADLLRLRLSATLQMTGDDTQLDAVAGVSPGAVTVEDAMGRAGSGLLALMPGLGLDCDGRGVVDVSRIVLRRARYAADGTIDLSEAVCRTGAVAVPLPPTALDLSSLGDAAVVTWRAQGGDTLAEAVLTPDRTARIQIEPAGARLIPGMPVSAATELTVPF